MSTSPEASIPVPSAKPIAPLVEEGYWPPGNSFVLPEHKMVYITTTKVACSSLRWMVADLVGEDFERFHRASGDHQTQLMTIHASRAIWQHSPQIKNVPPEQRAQISRDNGWFVFSMVRDPWSRLFSAWQSKFLVRHASYVQNYQDQPWFPRVPAKPGDILADWYAFVDARPWETHPLLKLDPHFFAQVDSVHPTGVNYTRIYDLSEMSELLTDIHDHLKAVDKDQQLYLPRVNESPVLLTPEVLENGVAAAIEHSFHRDFEAFGHFWSLDKVKTSDVPWSMDAVRAVGYHGQANRRIADLAWELKAARHAMRKAVRPAGGAKTGTAPPPNTVSVTLPPAAYQAAKRAKRAVRKAREELRRRRSSS